MAQKIAGLDLIYKSNKQIPALNIRCWRSGGKDLLMLKTK